MANSIPKIKNNCPKYLYKSTKEFKELKSGLNIEITHTKL